MVGKGSALIGIATACVLAAGGVAAARAPAPSRPSVGATAAASHVVTVLDSPTTTEAAPPPPAATLTGGAAVQITVAIPARTFVHLDSSGRPVEAMTNTGRPPQSSDQFFVDSGGLATPATEPVKAAVIRMATGAWLPPGAWHRLAT